MLLCADCLSIPSYGEITFSNVLPLAASLTNREPTIICRSLLFWFGPLIIVAPMMTLQVTYLLILVGIVWMPSNFSVGVVDNLEVGSNDGLMLIHTFKDTSLHAWNCMFL